jgi:hypothetical protein
MPFKFLEKFPRIIDSLDLTFCLKYLLFLNNYSKMLFLKETEILDFTMCETMDVVENFQNNFLVIRILTVFMEIWMSLQ